MEHWFLGSGLWTYFELYPQTGLGRTPPHAHNMYFQTAVETGLVGLGLLVACIIKAYSTFISIFKKGTSERKTDKAYYIVVSLSSYLIHNLIEYNWLISNFIYYFVFLLISLEVLNRDNPASIKCTYFVDAKGFWPKIIIN